MTRAHARTPRKAWVLFALAFAVGTGCGGSCGKGEDTSSQQSPSTGQKSSTIHIPHESHPLRLLFDAGPD